MSAPDGGPAFPTVPVNTENPAQYAGMSLRDYFAAAALPAVMQARVALVDADLGNDLGQESIAEECYELADALIEARSKPQEAES